MKYVITLKSGLIIEICNEIEYVEVDDAIKSIDSNTYHPLKNINMYEFEEIPDYVRAYSYFYDIENGFYENPNNEEIEEMI